MHGASTCDEMRAEKKATDTSRVNGSRLILNSSQYLVVAGIDVYGDHQVSNQMVKFPHPCSALTLALLQGCTSMESRLREEVSNTAYELISIIICELNSLV